MLLAMDKSLSGLSFDYSNKENSPPSFFYDSEGNYAVTYYYGKSYNLLLWKIDEKAHKPIMVHDTDHKASRVAISSEGDWVFSAFDNELTVWKINGDKLDKIMSNKIDQIINQIIPNKNGSMVLVEDTSERLRLYENTPGSLELAASQEKNGSFLTGIFTAPSIQAAERFALHPHGNAIIRGDREGNITSFLIIDGKIREVAKKKVFDGHRINGLMFTSDHSLLVQSVMGALESWRYSNGSLSDAHVLRTGSAQETRQLTLTRLSLSKDAKKIISRDRDGTIILWSLHAQGESFTARELAHPQQAGYVDAFFSNNVPVLWNAAEDFAWVMTKY